MCSDVNKIMLKAARVYQNIMRPTVNLVSNDKKHPQLEKVALDGSVECCAPPPRWCNLEL